MVLPSTLNHLLLQFLLLASYYDLVAPHWGASLSLGIPLPLRLFLYTAISVDMSEDVESHMLTSAGTPLEWHARRDWSRVGVRLGVPRNDAKHMGVVEAAPSCALYRQPGRQFFRIARSTCGAAWCSFFPMSKLTAPRPCKDET